jgi:hypothetical protein
VLFIVVHGTTRNDYRIKGAELSSLYIVAQRSSRCPYTLLSIELPTPVVTSLSWTLDSTNFQVTSYMSKQIYIFFQLTYLSFGSFLPPDGWMWLAEFAMTLNSITATHMTYRIYTLNSYDCLKDMCNWNEKL